MEVHAADTVGVTVAPPQVLCDDDGRDCQPPPPQSWPPTTVRVLPHSQLRRVAYPNTSGLGYAVFEDELQPVDWGVKTARKRIVVTLMGHVRWLLRFFRPSVVVRPCRRERTAGSKRLQSVSKEIAKLATHHGITVVCCTRADARQCFRQFKARPKDGIARAIAREWPEFEQHVPPARRLWMSEDYRMGIFDAVALAVTCVKGAK